MDPIFLKFNFKSDIKQRIIIFFVHFLELKCVHQCEYYITGTKSLAKYFLLGLPVILYWHRWPQQNDPKIGRSIINGKEIKDIQNPNWTEIHIEIHENLMMTFSWKQQHCWLATHLYFRGKYTNRYSKRTSFYFIKGAKCLRWKNDFLCYAQTLTHFVLRTYMKFDFVFSLQTIHVN